MNPNETKGDEMDEEDQDVQTCPTCGKEQQDWGGSGGRGFKKGGESYCCQGCAEGTGCTCDQESNQEAIGSTRGKEIPADKSRKPQSDWSNKKRASQK